MTSDTETQTEPTPRTHLGAARLAAYAVLVAWAFYEQATSWPHEGSWALVAYVFLCPGILFQLLSLAYTWRTGRALTRRWLARAVTVPAGLVLAAALVSSASTLAMDRFEAAYAPFVSRVRANLPEPCHAAGSDFRAPALLAYNEGTGRDRPAAKLFHDAKRFVLAFHGGSIDIDGSTIYYDSAAGAWRKFHNDNGEAQAAYAGLTAGLAECALTAK